MSETASLEQLLTEKKALEQESLTLDKEQKQLETEAKELCKDITKRIMEKNTEKKKTISNLHSQINSLRTQLSTLSVSETHVPKSLVAEEMNEAHIGPIPETNRRIGLIETSEIEITIPKQKKKN